MLSYHSTADEIVNANPDMAVLPIGSTEQHGPHLPIDTDNIIAGAIAKKVAEKLGALLLPTLPISTCREHMGKKGSVWINPDTFYHMLQDIVHSLKEQGFKRIVLLISHGGIFIAGPAVRELNAKNPDIRVIRADLVQFLQSPDIASLLECKDNLHACEFETSLIMYLCGELVRRDRVEDCIPGIPREFLNYGSILKFSKNGVWGMPSLASAEKGEKLFLRLADACVEYVHRVDGLFKE